MALHLQKIWGPPRNKIEVDCLIEMTDDVVVVEAKSTVTVETFRQLKYTCLNLKSLFGKHVLMFIRGANFQHALGKNRSLAGIVPHRSLWRTA